MGLEIFVKVVIICFIYQNDGLDEESKDEIDGEVRLIKLGIGKLILFINVLLFC